MIRFLRHFLVFLAVTGLSLQPVAAAWAAPCAHQASAQALPEYADHAGMVDSGHHDCHGTDADAGAALADGGAWTADSCMQCGICHLACAGALPVSAPATFARPAALPSTVAPPSTFLSHVGDLLVPPPRRV